MDWFSSSFAGLLLSVSSFGCALGFQHSWRVYLIHGWILLFYVITLHYLVTFFCIGRFLLAGFATFPALWVFCLSDFVNGNCNGGFQFTRIGHLRNLVHTFLEAQF